MTGEWVYDSEKGKKQSKSGIERVEWLGEGGWLRLTLLIVQSRSIRNPTPNRAR